MSSVTVSSGTTDKTATDDLSDKYAYGSQAGSALSARSELARVAEEMRATLQGLAVNLGGGLVDPRTANMAAALLSKGRGRCERGPSARSILRRAHFYLQNRLCPTFQVFFVYRCNFRTCN